MKTRIFLALLLIAGLAPAVAQNYYPDTVNYPFEKYFHYFDRNQWLAADTFVYARTWRLSHYIYDSVTDHRTGIMKWDTALFHVHHELTKDVPINYVIHDPEWVYYNYTPRPLKIVGIATNAKPTRPDRRFLSPDLPDSTEYLLLYDARPDTFVCRQRKVWDFNDSVRLVRLHYRGDSNYWHECCRDTTEYYTVEQFRESYFDRPVLVKDSFYLGGTCYSDDGNILANGAQNYINNFTTVLTYYADHAGVQWFDDEDYFFELNLDTCPIISSLIKTRYPRQKTPPETYLPWTPYKWEYHTLVTWIPQVYPIFEEMCPVVSGLHVENRQSDEVTVAWNAHGSHNVWMVSYGPLGMPRDSFATVSCLQPSLTITGLDSTRIYDICVQALCDYRASDYDFYDADVFGNHDTTFVSDWSKHLYLRGCNIVSINDISTPDDGILLRPNPADRQVTVSAPLPLKRVEVYDLAGRMVEAHQPNGTTLQIDLKTYPTGTYLVKVTTTNGTTTKKLVVK